MNSENINKKIGQAAKWSSITEVLVKLMMPITNMILARLLVPEAFGVVATITMVISFAEVFTDAGFQKYIVQHEFSDDETLDNSTNVAFWTNLSVSALICVIIFLFRNQIALLAGNPELGNSISIASILIIIEAFSSIQTARYRRAMDFKTLFYVRVITSLIPLVVTVPLAMLLRNYWALLIGTFASQLCSAIILTVRSKWKLKPYYNLELFKKMFAFSVWTLLESIAIWLTSYVGVFIVGNYLNDYYLGLYKTTISTVNAYMSIITGALTPVLFSALSRYQNDEENFKKIYYQFQRMTAVLVIPMGVGIFLFSDLATRVLLGENWMEASGFIGLWGLTSTFTIVFAHFSSEVYRSKGKPKISLVKQLIHLAFLVPLLMWTAPMGFTELYIARSLVRIQSIVTALIFMHVMYKFLMWQQIKNVFPMMVSTAVMGLVGYFLLRVSESMLWQFVSVFICIIVYFCVLLGCFRNVRNEILNSAIGRRMMRNFEKKTNSGKNA